MKRFLLLPPLLAGLFAAEPQKIFPEKPDGWKMAGPGSFEIAENIATAKGGMGLWWFSQKEYQNACFEVVFKATDPAQNSGVFLRFPNPGNDPWVAVKKGYEIQISGKGDAKHTAGAVYDLQGALKPNYIINDWNYYRIITAGNQIAIILNGQLINVFECQPGRGDEKGYFGLQNHDDGSPVQFRKVAVQELQSNSILTAFDELKIPRSQLTKYWAKRNPAKDLVVGKRNYGKDWHRLADHGPAFFQTFGDWFEGEERTESALKGILLSYSAFPNRVALFNSETLALVSATDQGTTLMNTPWARGHGKVNRFNNKDSALFTLANLPAWADSHGSFRDTREIRGHGNFPYLKFNGYFRNGSEVILDYKVHGTRILDLIEDHKDGLVRHLEIAPHTNALNLRLADSSSKRGLKIKLRGEGASVLRIGNSHYLSIGALSKTQHISLLYTHDSEKEAPANRALSPLTKGGAGISPESYSYDVQHGEKDGPWIVDRLPLPADILQDYLGKVRISDLDFFSDGDRLLLTTWDGDIWMVSGLKEFKRFTWKRYATGFFEPLGVRIINDTPYIAGRDAIYKTYDLNYDGEADKFEIFNNDVYLTSNFHEFQFGLETDSAGNFYFAKAAPVLSGGRGFDKILPHNGTFLKLSSDGKKLEVIATGLRAPGGIAIGPNGEITTGENEGTWQPCCKINYYEPSRGNAFFGVENARHGNPTPYVEPICYLPMDVDNSGGGQIWVPENNQIGIKGGELIHLSYGQSAIYHVLRQKVSDGFYQGGVAKLPVKLASSAQRAAFHSDGSMYVVGFRGWQTNAAGESGIQRIRRNDQVASPIPSAMEVTKEGVKLTFQSKLDPELAKDPSSFTVERWKYIRSVQYGSGQFSVDKPNVAAEKAAFEKESKNHRERDKVKVLEAILLPDNMSVLIKLEGHKPSQQLKIDYDLETENGDELTGILHSTIHQVPSN